MKLMLNTSIVQTTTITGLILQSESNLKLSFTTRHDKRVPMALDLYLRREINSAGYSRRMRSINISRHGACIFSDVKLEVGTLLEVSGLNDRFSAQAIVCHVRKRRTGGWLIGLNFIKKTGQWVIN
jgi:hypothetical protein